MMEKVPQDEPVEKDMMALATKMITGSVQAGTLSCSMLTTNSGPPMALVTLLSTHARSRVMNTLAILSRPAT